MAFIGVTQTFSLPPGLLSAVCWTESSHRTQVVHKDDGNGTSLGVCQIKLSTARTLGFKGTEKELMAAKTNVYWAGRYLSKQLDRYHGDIVKAVAAYNAGSYREAGNGQAKNQKYLGKVFQAWSLRK